MEKKVDGVAAAFPGDRAEVPNAAVQQGVQPSLILLDEPIGAVNTETAEQLVALLKSLNEKDEVTIVVVTHDLDVAKGAKRQIRLKDGRVVADEAVAPVALA